MNEHVDLIEQLFAICESCDNKSVCIPFRCNNLNTMLDCQRERGATVMYDYFIVCDGGCLGNGTDHTRGYGSFKLTTKDGRTKMVRLEFPSADTNNKAEYLSVINALKHVATVIKHANRNLKDYSIEIRMDSALVINQCNSLWRCKSVGLLSLFDEAKELLNMFKLCTFVKISGDEMKGILGH